MLEYNLILFGIVKPNDDTTFVGKCVNFPDDEMETSRKKAINGLVSKDAVDGSSTVCFSCSRWSRRKRVALQCIF